MAYTDDPQNIPADQLRFYIGDTDNQALDLTDAQVAFLLDTEGSPVRGAARAAEILSAKYTKAADEKRVGPLLLRSYVSTADAYSKLAKRLWSRAATGSATPFAGGISITDKVSRIEDPERVHPSFTRRMMAYPNISNQSAQEEDLLSPPDEVLP